MWVVLGLLAVLRRDWRLGVTPALVGVLYLPWLLTTRQTYIYYMVPVVPFIAVLVATGLARFAGAPWAEPPGAAPASDAAAAPLEPGEEGGGRRGRRIVAWAFCAACVVVGVLYVPFVLGTPVPFEYYRLLTPFTTWK